MKTWLLVDVKNVAYRALYTSGHLSHGGDPTGVLYGFLRDLVTLQDRFASHRLVFCFDHGRTKREKEFRYYKSKRRGKKKPETMTALHTQVELLRTRYLERLGYPNVFWQYGYEADDIIASVCRDVEESAEDEEAIIISDDKDFYQLLRSRVRVYHPRAKKLVTRKSFVQTYGIRPRQWIDAKAIAGCSSDDIPGMAGVGEKTVLKYLKGEELAKDGRYRIDQFKQLTQTYRDNIKLIRLPYPGTNHFALCDHDPPTKEAWRELMEKLGMRSLASHDPGARTLFG